MKCFILTSSKGLITLRYINIKGKEVLFIKHLETYIEHQRISDFLKSTSAEIVELDKRYLDKKMKLYIFYT